MANSKKKSQKPPHLSLHHVITAMSYWGSSVRLGLIAFVALVVLLLQVFVAPTSEMEVTRLSAFIIETQVFLYTMFCFALLDIGYVTVARKYPFYQVFDRLALLLIELFLGVAYFLPSFAVVSENATNSRRFVLLAVAGFVLARFVIGKFHRRAE